MRPISKALFFSLVVLIFAFSPVIGEQPKPDSTLKVTNLRERDLLRKKGIEPIPGLRDRYPSMFNGIVPFPYTESFQHPLRRDFPYANSTGTLLTPAEKRAMKAIVDDFLVNDDISTAMQDFPAISTNRSGNFIIAWKDRRNYTDDIYVQRYNSLGTPLGSNFKVNDFTANAPQGGPAICMSSSGSFVITWGDYYDIYAQRYNSAGTPLGSNFKVNDDSGSAKQYDPAVSMDSSGNFIITWQDYRNGNPDIYAQRYNSNGAPLGFNFKVNGDAGSASQSHPTVSMDASGNAIITWQDGRNSGPGIYGQRYNSSGTPLGSNFKVSDNAGTVWQGHPTISMDSSGNFAIAWEDGRSGNYDIYAERYNSSGMPLGSNFKVNDDSGSAQQDDPAVCMDRSGNFIITWYDWRHSGPGIYAQRYAFSGTPLGFNFKVSDYADTVWDGPPAISMDGSGNFVVAWRPWYNGNPEIYARRYNYNGIALGSSFKVNDDISTASQDSSAISVDGSGNFVITWKDYRNFSLTADIYAQRYNFSGMPLGFNFKVNDDAGLASQSQPAISMDRSGNFVITWEDPRNGNSDIYAQRYNYYGTPLGSNFKVNDDAGTTGQYLPAISMDGPGNFIITWYDCRNNYNIYAQRYNSSGMPLGSNFKVNDNIGTSYNPAVSMDSSGDFVITWKDYRNSTYYADIYAQRYDSSGSQVGSNFKVNYDSVSASRFDPAISMNGSGDFVIAWEDYRNGFPHIYAQKYNSAGGSIGVNYMVSDYFPDTFFYENQAYPSVAAYNSHYYFTWMDNRRGNGWDIYTNVSFFMRGDVNGDDKVSLSDVVYLINYLFKFGPEPIPETGIGDANCDGKVSLSDIVYLINYLFKFGPAPCP